MCRSSPCTGGVNPQLAEDLLDGGIVVVCRLGLGLGLGLRRWWWCGYRRRRWGQWMHGCRVRSESRVGSACTGGQRRQLRNRRRHRLCKHGRILFERVQRAFENIQPTAKAKMSQFVNQVMFLRSAFDELNRRLVAVEQRPQYVPQPQSDVGTDTKTMEEVQQQLTSDVRREVRSAVEKEKHVLETMLGYKVEQTVSKLVRERVEQLRTELQQTTTQVDSSIETLAEQDHEQPQEPAAVSATSEQGLVLKTKKKTGGRKAQST